MNKRGFSIVELIVVITIMAILLSIAAVSFRNYQVDARNEQRRNRAENIARYIEAIYNTGSTSPIVDKGEYPSLDTLADSASTAIVNPTKLEALFGKNGFDLSNLKSAGKDTYGLRVTTGAYYDQPNAASLTPDQYLYQPLKLYDATSYSLRKCYDSTDECRSFNIYYKTEGDNVVHKISSIH